MKVQSKLILLGVIVSATLFGIKHSFINKNTAIAQPRNCNNGFECFELALKELEQAKKEIRALEKQLEDRVKKAETKADVAQTTANDAVNKANTAQATANTAVTKADAAQTTANDAVNKANAAQSTANKIGGLHYVSDGIYVFPTPNGAVHLGGGGTCYYEGNSQRWCHRSR